jgi:putative IMPACT (imprinted ancient) family translation regulator
MSPDGDEDAMRSIMEQVRIDNPVLYTRVVESKEKSWLELMNNWSELKEINNALEDYMGIRTEEGLPMYRLPLTQHVIGNGPFSSFNTNNQLITFLSKFIDKCVIWVEESPR